MLVQDNVVCSQQQSKTKRGHLYTGIAFSADLEYQKGCNQAVHGEGMVDRLLELVAQQLKVSNSHLSMHAVHALHPASALHAALRQMYTQNCQLTSVSAPVRWFILCHGTTWLAPGHHYACRVIVMSKSVCICD